MTRSAHDLDTAGLERSLRHGVPELADATVASVAKFPRGVSRETWFVTLDVPGDKPRDVVVRRDLPAGSVTPTTLRFEYEVYRRLADGPVPVARTLYYEDDPDFLVDGRELYVREKVDGSWDIPHFSDPDPAFDEVRIEASKELMRRLAALHTADWDALGFGEIMVVPPTPDDSAAVTIDRMEALLATYQVEPLPAVTEGIEALRRTAPTGVPRVSLLKGTNGMGEEVWRDGRIVAMSDWELASLGDPASDFAHVQRLKPRVVDDDGNLIWSLEHAIAYYERKSGIPIDMARVEYYRKLGALETVLYSHYAGIPLVHGTDFLVRRSWVSTEVQFEAVRRLASTAGID